MEGRGFNFHLKPGYFASCHLLLLKYIIHVALYFLHTHLGAFFMERKISNYIKAVIILTLLQDPEEGIAVLIDGLQWEEALRLVS